MCANRYIASHTHSRHRTRETLLPVWLYASSPVWLYTHDASVVICELAKMRTYHIPMMPVWLYTHDASVVICERHLNANENDSHSAIMGTQRAPHVSKYSLTYNHAGCVGICQPSLTYRHEGLSLYTIPRFRYHPFERAGGPY